MAMANVSMNLGFAMIGLTVQTVQMKLTVSQKVVLMVQLKTVQVMAIVLLDHGLVMAGVMAKINHLVMT